MARVRPYRGVEADARLAQRRHRFVDAGLDLLGGVDDPPELTVRALCAHAGVSARYFYESFADKDVFVAAVFDGVIADIVATTQAAVASAPLHEQNRAGMANVVESIARDARIGRLLFSTQLSNPVIVTRRAQAGALLATLYGRELGTALGIARGETVSAVAHFAVGGVGQVISAWLSGDVELTPSELVDRLATLLDALADPRLCGRPPD